MSYPGWVSSVTIVTNEIRILAVFRSTNLDKLSHSSMLREHAVQFMLHALVLTDEPPWKRPFRPGQIAGLMPPSARDPAIEVLYHVLGQRTSTDWLILEESREHPRYGSWIKKVLKQHETVVVLPNCKRFGFSSFLSKQRWVRLSCRFVIVLAGRSHAGVCLTICVHRASWMGDVVERKFEQQ